MSTFSQIVDEIATQLLKPDQVNLIASQLNLTLREVFSTERNTPVTYGSARVEEMLIADVESGFIWNLPNPYIFQTLETMRFDSVFDNLGNPIYPVEIQPGRVMNAHDHFYYRTGDSFAIQGYGGVGASIAVSYFQFAPSLKYYPAGTTRPAEFDPVDGWTYAAAYDVSDATRAQAEALTSNWLTLKWKETIAEGTRAKMYKLASDQDRARVSFSLFQSLRTTLQRTEAYNSLRH